MKHVFTFLFIFIWMGMKAQQTNPPVSSKGIWLRTDVAGMIPNDNKMFEFGIEHRGFFPAQSVVWSVGVGWYNLYNTGPIAHIQTDELKAKKVVGAEVRQYLYHGKNRTGPFVGIQCQGYSVKLHTRMRDTVFPQLGYFFDTTTVRNTVVSQIRLGYKWMDRNQQWSIEPSIGLGFGAQLAGEYYTIFQRLNFPNSITRFRLCIARKF